MSTQETLLHSELGTILEKFGCQAGTIHRFSPDDGLLHLVTSIGIPEPVIAIIQKVPVGKGMAGLAAERNEPVQVCNLQTDNSGKARIGARATGMEGSIAVPMRLAENPGGVAGVLGVAKATPYDFTEEELAALLAEGTRLADRF